VKQLRSCPLLVPLLASALVRSRILVCALLAALVFAAYLPSLRNGFTGYDDPDYVTANPRVNTGLTAANVAWAFGAAHAGNWHPLTWISHMADCTLFGLSPIVHHLDSLLLHIATTLLLFLWLTSATGATARSALVALVFGLHPVHVESVAWISERKDVLSAFFLILTLLAYTAYTRRPGAARYSLTLALFAAGLLSKPMLVTLPVLLLLIDRWPLRRPFSLRDKLPLAALSAASCALTVWAQQKGGTISAISQLPLAIRLSNAATSYLRYLGKTIWPVRLAAFYPFPGSIPWWAIAGSLAALAAISFAAFRLRITHPWIAAGWSWYLLTLLPVIGLVQVGMQAMADRYLYVPMIGLLIAFSWELPQRLTGPAAVVAAAGCALLTWNQVQVWKDGVTLWTHAIAVTERNFVAHDNLGVELDRAGRREEALAQYREAVAIRPGDRNAERNYAQANFAAGERRLTQGDLVEALSLFREGLRHDPRQPLAHTYAGLILTQQHQLAGAIEEFRLAIALDPASSRAHMGLGVALAWSERPADAERELRTAVRGDPASVEAWFDLGLVQAALGQRREALESLDTALRLNPNFAGAREAGAKLRGLQ
jgi:protein O-mannosyl-transferase